MEELEEPMVDKSRPCGPCSLKSAQEFYKVLDDLVFSSQTYRKKFELIIYPRERSESDTTIEVRTYENRICSDWNQNILPVYIFHLTYSARGNREYIKEPIGCCFNTKDRNLVEEFEVGEHANEYSTGDENKNSILHKDSDDVLQCDFQHHNEYDIHASQNSPEITYRYILDDEYESECLLEQDLESATTSNLNFDLNKQTWEKKDCDDINHSVSSQVNQTNSAGSNLSSSNTGVGLQNQETTVVSASNSTVEGGEHKYEDKRFLISLTDETSPCGQPSGLANKTVPMFDMYPSSTIGVAERKSRRLLTKQEEISKQSKLTERSVDRKVISIKQEKNAVISNFPLYLDEELSPLNHIQIMDTWSINEQQFSKTDACEQDLTLHHEYTEENLPSGDRMLSHDNKTKVLVNCKRVRNEIDKKSLKSAVAVEKQITKERCKQKTTLSDDPFVIENVFGDVIYVMTEDGNCTTQTVNEKPDKDIDIKPCYNSCNQDCDSIPIAPTYPTGIIQNAYAPELPTPVFCVDDCLVQNHTGSVHDQKEKQQNIKVSKVKGNRKTKLNIRKTKSFKDAASYSKKNFSKVKKSTYNVIGKCHPKKKQLASKKKALPPTGHETGSELIQTLGRQKKDEEQFPSPKKRGRPKCKGTPSEKVKQVKRKPGRPRKTKAFKDNECSAAKTDELECVNNVLISSSDEQTVCKTRKKRGCPKLKGSNIKLLEGKVDINLMKNMSLIERGKFIDFWLSKRAIRPYSKFPFKVGSKQKVNFESEKSEKTNKRTKPPIKIKKAKGRPKKTFDISNIKSNVNAISSKGNHGLKGKNEIPDTISMWLASDTSKNKTIDKKSSNNDVCDSHTLSLRCEVSQNNRTVSESNTLKSDVKIDDSAVREASKLVVATSDKEEDRNIQFSNRSGEMSELLTVIEKSKNVKHLSSPEKSPQYLRVKPINDQRRYSDCVSEDLIVKPIAMKTMDDNGKNIFKSSLEESGIQAKSSHSVMQETSKVKSYNKTGPLESVNLDKKVKKKIGRPRKPMNNVNDKTKSANALCKKFELDPQSLSIEPKRNTSEEITGMRKIKKGRPTKGGSKCLKSQTVKPGLLNTVQRKKRGRPSKSALKLLMCNDHLDDPSLVLNSYSFSGISETSSQGGVKDYEGDEATDRNCRNEAVYTNFTISGSSKKQLKKKLKKCFHKQQCLSIKSEKKLPDREFSEGCERKMVKKKVKLKEPKRKQKNNLVVCNHLRENERNVSIKGNSLSVFLLNSYGLDCSNEKPMADLEGNEDLKISKKKTEMNLETEDNLSLVFKEGQMGYDVEMKPLEMAQFPNKIIKKRGRPPKMPVLTCEKVESVENMFDKIKKGRAKASSENDLLVHIPTSCSSKKRGSKVIRANRIMKKYHSSLMKNCVTNTNVLKKKRGRPRKDNAFVYEFEKKEMHELKDSSEKTSDNNQTKKESIEGRSHKIIGCKKSYSYLSGSFKDDDSRKKKPGRPKKMENHQKCHKIKDEYKVVTLKETSSAWDPDKIFNTCNKNLGKKSMQNELEIHGKHIELDSQGIVSSKLKKKIGRPKKIVYDFQLNNSSHRENENNLSTNTMNLANKKGIQIGQYSGSVSTKNNKGKHKNSLKDSNAGHSAKKKKKTIQGRQKEISSSTGPCDKHLRDIRLDSSDYLSHSMRPESESSEQNYKVPHTTVLKDVKRDVSHRTSSTEKRKGHSRTKCFKGMSELTEYVKDSQNSPSYTLAPVIQQVEGTGEVSIDENELEMPVIDFEGSVSQEQSNSVRLNDVYVDKETLLTLTKIAGSKIEMDKDHMIPVTTEDTLESKAVNNIDADFLNSRKCTDSVSMRVLEDSCENTNSEASPSKDVLNAELSRLKCGFEVVFEVEDSNIKKLTQTVSQNNPR